MMGKYWLYLKKKVDLSFLKKLALHFAHPVVKFQLRALKLL